jgi:hypothetical protein
MLLYAGRRSIEAQYIVVDVKSAMARFGLPVYPPSNARNELETVAWFRFPITWSYLNGPPIQRPERALSIRPASQIPPAGMGLASTVSALPFQATAPVDTAAFSGNPGLANAAAQWEMVIPKMARPLSKSVAARSGVVAPPALAAPLPEPASVAQDPLPSAFRAPSLLLYSSDDKFLARYWRQLAVALVALAMIGFLLFARSGAGAASVTAGPKGWSQRSISPPGRLMSVYEPSRGETDYRMEFAWVPDANGVGWIFRARDANDYYAVRLRLIKPGAGPAIAAEHFNVWRGEESVHSRKVIPLLNNSGLVQVRMDAVGPSFTLSLQDSPVDTWTDARLDSGPLGFYDENGQRPAVEALRFTFIGKGTTRTAVASLP